MKHYLQFSDLTADEYAYLLERAAFIKAKFKAVEKYQPFADPDRWQRGAPHHGRQPAWPQRTD